MEVRSAEFVRSVFKIDQIPLPHLDEVAFFGRSNVGKSTLLNCLTGQKIARTSGTPGKTQCLNYYLINGSLYFVDAPGYGFAKVPVKLRVSWEKMIDSWLREHARVRAAIQVVDGRHEIQDNDRRTLAWLHDFGMPVVVAVNKMDKLKNSQRHHTLKQFGGDAVYKQTKVIPMSAATGEGRQVLLSTLSEILQTRR